MADRPLPQNLEAERGLLGIILEVNDALHEVSGIVRKEDFFEPFHVELFTLMRDMIETNRVATPATLLHDLSQDAAISDGVTASEYMAMLQREAPHQGLARTFARTVRDLALRRRLIDVLGQHLDEAYSAPATITATEIEARYQTLSSQLFGRVQDAGMRPIADVSRDLLKSTQTLLQGDKRRGLTTGLKALDDLWGPLLPGRHHALAGASGSGKTALAWQIARELRDPTGNNVPVLFCSLEMDGDELVTRDLNYLTGVSAAKIDAADLNEEEFRSLAQASRGYGISKIVIEDGKGLTIGAIRGKAMRMKRLQGLSAIVIDHWRYIKSPPKVFDQFEAMHDNLRAINALADDLEVPVILLAQFRSQYGQEMTVPPKPGQPFKVREPNVGDIYNGAVLEQEADALVLVHREEYMLARMRPAENADADTRVAWKTAMQEAKNKATLILNKRRGGAGWGKRVVGFHPEITTFTDEVPRFDMMDDTLLFGRT